MNAIDLSPHDQRIMDLAKKICELYSPADLEKLAPISPQTIQRWADNKHRPSKSTAMALPQIIAVSDDDFNKYLQGDITLDELWNLKGSAKRVTNKQEVTVQSVLNDAKRLTTEQRLKLMSHLFLTISPHDLPTNKPELIEPEYIALSAIARKRLKTLLDLSNIYLQQTYQSIIESGANKVLVEDLVNELNNQYTKEVFQTILPFLCRCTEWRDNVPINANPAQYFDSFEELLTSLNSPSLN